MLCVSMIFSCVSFLLCIFSLYLRIFMDISMDIHRKSVDMDMDGKFHIHGKPDYLLIIHHQYRHHGLVSAYTENNYDI